MTKSNEQLKEKEIDRELRGEEGEPTEERVVGTQDTGNDPDTADMTSEEAMEEADMGEKIIEAERRRQQNS